MQISKSLDAEFEKDMPDLVKIKNLSKKLQQLQHSYDGVIILDSKYDFRCKVKWIYESDTNAKMNSKVIKLAICLFIPSLKMDLNIKSIESITDPSTIQLILALSKNIQLGKKDKSSNF